MYRDSLAETWREDAPYDRYDPYPELRQLMAPEYASLHPEELEELLLQEGISPEDLEGFFSSLKKFAKKAAPFVQKALPAVGTVVGTAFGGPAGGALGGLAGGLAGKAIGAATQPHPRPGAPSRLQPRLPPRRPRGPIRPQHLQAFAGGSPAASQLLGLLTRPQTLQALAGMVLGGGSRGQVQVGGSPVPLGAITNLLGVLANRASAEYHTATAGTASGTPLYLLDDFGELLVDPADPEERADALLLRFAQEDVSEDLGGGEAEELWEDDEEGLLATLLEDDPGALEAYYDDVASEDEEAYFAELELAEDFDDDLGDDFDTDVEADLETDFEADFEADEDDEDEP